MVTDHMIFLVDLKDWSGTIESDLGNWLHNGRDTGPSPVAKIYSNVKDVLRLLTTHLRSSKGCPIPKIVEVVVITGKAKLSGIAATERSSVFEIDDFLKTLGSENLRRAAFGNVAPQIVADPLTGAVWKDRFVKFFNVKAGPFKPGRLRYDRYVATSDQAAFQHPNDIYREYEAEEENMPRNLGTLRLWNFANCKDGRFQTEEGRAEIAGGKARSSTISAIGTKIARIGFWFRRRSTQSKRQLLGGLRPPAAPKAAARFHLQRRGQPFGAESDRTRTPDVGARCRTSYFRGGASGFGKPQCLARSAFECPDFASACGEVPRRRLARQGALSVPLDGDRARRRSRSRFQRQGKGRVPDRGRGSSDFVRACPRRRLARQSAGLEPLRRSRLDICAATSLVCERS